MGGKMLLTFIKNFVIRRFWTNIKYNHLNKMSFCASWRTRVI